MDSSQLWWIAAGLLVVAELMSGTFYLLMLAIGLAGAGFVAQAEASISTQVFSAAALGGLSVLVLRYWRSRAVQKHPERAAPLDLDHGQRVHVAHWRQDGTASVHYRGAPWTARWGADTAAVSGECSIISIDGSRLVLGPPLVASPSPEGLRS